MQEDVEYIGDFRLELTCGACPEQYDVYLYGSKVAYLRLRHGRFSASVPDHTGVEIYTASPEGDGAFFPGERTFYLREALRRIREVLLEEGRDVPEIPGGVR